MNLTVFLNWVEGFEAQAPFGNVQHRPTVIVLQLQEGKLIRHLSGIFAAFQDYISQGHVSSEACLIFGMPFSGGEVKVCRIGGAGGGAKPSLPTSPWPFYPSAPGIKLSESVCKRVVHCCRESHHQESGHSWRSPCVPRNSRACPNPFR